MFDLNSLICHIHYEKVRESSGKNWKKIGELSPITVFFRNMAITNREFKYYEQGLQYVPNHEIKFLIVDGFDYLVERNRLGEAQEWAENNGYKRLASSIRARTKNEE